MTVKRRRKRQRGGSAVRETIPKKIRPTPPPLQKKKKVCREAKAASGLKHDGVRTGMELQLVSCCMGIEKWGGGADFCYFCLSWSIWFSRLCSLNTLARLLPLQAVMQIHVCSSDTKTHVNTQLSQPTDIQSIQRRPCKGRYVCAYAVYMSTSAHAAVLTRLSITRYLNY